MQLCYMDIIIVPARIIILDDDGQVLENLNDPPEYLHDESTKLFC